jgi:hypothetical protein
LHPARQSRASVRIRATVMILFIKSPIDKIKTKKFYYILLDLAIVFFLDGRNNLY